MNILINLFLIFGFVISSEAQMLISPYQILSDTSEITVFKDGTSEAVYSHEFSIMNDEGRSQLSLYRHYYNPLTESAEVLEAKSIYGKDTKVVSKKEIQEKEISVSGPGLDRTREITIPFEGLQVASRVILKIKVKNRVPKIKDFYDTQFVYGVGAAEMKSVVIIKSEMPLYHQTANDNMVLSIRTSKEGKWWRFEANLLRPIYSLSAEKIKSEDLTISDVKLVPRLLVSSEPDWTKFQTILKNYYANRMDEKLPAIAKAFIKELKAKDTIETKAYQIRMWVKNKFTYSGRWQSKTSGWLPRTLNEITKTKVGDCKDFSFLLTKMLREIGVHADIAFVGMTSRSPLSHLTTSPANEQSPLPVGDYFNHAIVRAVINDKPVYLDPTTSFVQSARSDLHLHQKWAFSLDKNALKLQKLEIESDNSTVSNSVRKTAEGYLVTSKMSIRGSFANFLSMIKEKNSPELMQKAVAAIAGFHDGQSIKLKNVNVKLGAVPQIDIESELISSKRSIQTKDNIVMYSQTMALPIAYWYYLDRTLLPAELDFPLEITAETLFDGYYAKNEEKHDCFFNGPYFRYDKKVINSDQGLKVVESSRTAFLPKLYSEVDIDYGSYNWSSAKDCQSKSTLSLVALDKKDKSQVYFDSAEPSPEAILKIKDSSSFAQEQLEIRRKLLNWIAKDPNEAQYYFFLTRAINLQGYYNGDNYVPEHLAESRKVALKGLELDKNSSFGWTRLGTIDYYLGRNADAVAAYVKAQQLDNKNADAYNLAAKLAERGNNNAHALAYYRLSEKYETKVKGKTSALLGQITILCSKDESCIESKPLLDKMVQYDPENRWNLHNAAIYYDKLGFYDEAIKLERKALADKEFGAAQQVLASALAGKANKVIKEVNGKIPPETYSAAENLIEEARQLDSGSTRISEALFSYNFAKAKELKDEQFLQKAKQNLSAATSRLDIKKRQKMIKDFILVRDQIHEQTGKRNIASLNKEFGKHKPSVEADSKKEKAAEFEQVVSSGVQMHFFNALNDCKFSLQQSYRSILKLEADGTIAAAIPEEINKETECFTKSVIGKKLSAPPSAPFYVGYEQLN